MVGIVIVSHSYKVAEGVYDLAMQMAAENDHIIPAGGMEDNSIGTDAFKIMQAIEQADTGDGVAILADLGSGIMSAEMAIEMRTAAISKSASRTRLSWKARSAQL